MVAATAVSAHYLLYVDVLDDDSDRWQFRLESLDGRELLAAEDAESDCGRDRLALFGLVRGLEALDEPGRVTLVTSAAYLRRGLAYGLSEWRENHWLWERFGQWVSIKNGDLWRRVDAAIQIHTLDSRIWRFDKIEQIRAGRRQDQSHGSQVRRPKFLNRNDTTTKGEMSACA